VNNKPGDFSLAQYVSKFTSIEEANKMIQNASDPDLDPKGMGNGISVWMFSGVEHDDQSDDSGYMFLWNSLLMLNEAEAIWVGEPSLNCGREIMITIPKETWDHVRIMFV
jgi:hypothetical protein